MTTMMITNYNENHIKGYQQKRKDHYHDDDHNYNEDHNEGCYQKKEKHNHDEDQ